MKKYEVKFSRTDNYLVTVEAETEGAALVVACQAVKSSDPMLMKLVSNMIGNILVEDISEVTT